jgi:nitroimidazol reductase NimA-like FMN-containing flavoprotein (pyridoxamine 5'-phosphate oxidase superfamily)
VRHRNREITDKEEIDRIIRQADICRLGLSRDNRPYVVPVSFGYDGDFIYFHTGREGLKIDYLQANDRVCFEMECDVRMLPDNDSACKWSVTYLSVIGFGRAEEITETQGIRFALNLIMKHYSGREWEFDAAALERTRVWRIAVEEMTGKRSKDRVADRPDKR